MTEIINSNIFKIGEPSSQFGESQISYVSNDMLTRLVQTYIFHYCAMNGVDYI